MPVSWYVEYSKRSVTGNVEYGKLQILNKGHGRARVLYSLAQRIIESVTNLQVGQHSTHVRSNNVDIGLFTQTRSL